MALPTLGEDKEVVDAVRHLTPKVTAHAKRAGTKKRDFERLSTEMQQSISAYVADKCLGNVKE